MLYANILKYIKKRRYDKNLRFILAYIEQYR